MTFGLASYGLGLTAGVLSTLSPCVLPIVPILLGSATTAHRHAPWALAAGLALSYAVVGSTLAWAGASLGVDTSVFRTIGAVLVIALGVLLLSAGLQQRFASATSGLGDAGHRLLSSLALDGLKGQFVVGLVLGVVWSPCVGPTLGAAVVLAAQSSHLPEVALLMGLFGLGAALPIVGLGLLSQRAMQRSRGALLTAGQTGKKVFGVAMLLVGVAVLTGVDKPVETWLLDHSPDALTSLTTRF